MNYQEELARLRANLDRLDAFVQANLWLLEVGETVGLYPDTDQLIVVCENGGFPEALRPRLRELSPKWERQFYGAGTKADWETKVDGITLSILNAEVANLGPKELFAP